MSTESQQHYWDSLSAYPVDASVIDPNDGRGCKNAYLAGIRNAEILGALAVVSRGDAIADLGCGTGSLTSALVGDGRIVVGVDISAGLLHRTASRRLGDAALFVHFDGHRLPLVDRSVTAVTTYVVLTHVIEDGDLLTLLREVVRVLRPGGRLIAIEQVRRTPRKEPIGWKHHRTLAGLKQLFASAGLRIVSAELIRFGHFPTTPLVRMGIVPKTLFPMLARMERRFGRWIGVPPGDYCDVRFVLESRDDGQ